MKQKKKKFKMWNKLLAFLGMFVMLTGCLEERFRQVLTKPEKREALI